MTKAKITFCNEQKLIQEEKERLRKLRIIQVREISKQNAANLRQAFRNEKDKEIKKQLDKKETVKKHEYEENFNEIKQFVQREIDNIGSGHLSAAHYDEKIEFRQKQAAENEERAAIRGRTAFLTEKAERAQVENKENAHIIARQNAIEQEKIRAAKIAKLPKPTDDNLESVVSKKPVKLVSMHDVDAFMTTRYHMPETIVNKASLEEMDDARQSAVDEELRLKNFEHNLKRQSNERNEKARLRGKHALEKEILSENYNDIMKELNILEQADREKRQKELLNIPREIFVPSWQREQDKKEFQLELEREFEKIYVDANMRKEEMPEPMDPKKIDEMSQNGIGEDSELDLTVLNEEPQLSEDIVPIKLNAENLKQNEIHPKVSPNPCENDSAKCSPKSNEQNVLQASQEVIPESTEQHMNNANNYSKNQSSKESIVLSKLLEKIKKQREEIAQKSSGVNLSLEDSNVSDLPTNDKDCEEKQKNDENLIEKSLNESRKSKTANELEEESEPSESSEELSYTLSLNSNTPRSDVETNDKKASLNNREKKLIKGIMMSSHNVSSVRDFTLDHNRMILNSKMDSQQNFKSNAHSMDLSHASRDIMVAGPKELFNKNDVKLAIELKQKQLQKQQQELEEKLRKLEEQQNELEKQTKKTNSNSSNQNQSLSETNNSLTLSHSINSNKSHKLTSENTEKSKTPIDEDEIKRIDYQKKLLELTSTKTLAKCAENDNQFDKLIEDRKKEIQKKFGLEVHSSSNSSLNTIKDQNNIKQKPVKTIIQSDDKHTIYSGDSGFVSSSNNYNMNLRNQQIAKRPINMAVEQLNKEVLNAAKNKNPVDLLNFLNGEMNEEEYRRRLSLITNQSDSTLTNEQLSKLFGLEFYDSNNMSDVRDSSIEKMIGWSILQAKMEKETKSKSSGLCSKTNMSSASSDDTLNDQSSNDFSDNDDKSDDGHLLIMSLLKCNKNKQNDEVNNLEFKKQIIQDQLEMVRRQKDQLDIQQSKNCKAFNTTSLPPPVKFNKFVNDHNLHELSTIKEVDTPISERNIKLTNSTKYQTSGINKSSINLTTVSSMDASSSSLENVTQLNESNQVQTSRTANMQSQNQSHGISAVSSAISPSTSLFCTTIVEENLSQSNKNHSSKSFSASSSSFTSTSTPIVQPSTSKTKINLEELRTHQKQLLNTSLFNSSNKSSYSSISNSPSSQKAPKVEYGELIFNSLATNNLSVSQNTTSQTSLSNSSQKPVAFKTESTLDTSDLFKKYNLNSNNNNNNSDNSQSSSNNKKWFDILASTTDEEKSVSQSKLSTSKLSQGPLLDDTLENDQDSKIFSLVASENKSSIMSASPSVLINSLNSTKMETLRDLEPESEMRSLKSCSYASEENSSFRSNNGMFGKFLKNYNSTTGASVMDEPEISFVSYKTISNPVSPRTVQSFSDYSRQSSESSYSLIKLQKKQLSQQFADFSSIEQPSSLSSSQIKKSFTTTIPFETTSMLTNNESTIPSRVNYSQDLSRTECYSEKVCESDRHDGNNSKKSESLLTFYDQELTNLTPINQKCESTVFLKTLVQSEEDLHNSTMVSLKEANTSNKQQSAFWNSAPMVSSSELKFMTNQFQDSCTFENFGQSENTNESASLMYFNESTNCSFAQFKTPSDFLEDPTCQTCAYCRSFYTIINKDSRNQIKTTNDILGESFRFNKDFKSNRKDLARNVTQEFYFVDFDGNRFDLRDIRKNALQTSCTNHLKRIRCNFKISIQKMKKLNHDKSKSRMNQFYVKDKKARENRLKLENYNSYIKVRNKKIFSKQNL